MGLILNIDTATEICSVSLSNEFGLIDSRENFEGKSHASLLTVFIDDILKSNNYNSSDLSAVAVSKGPGSYTGLRIGVSAAKGICFGSDIPLIAVSTLQIMSYHLIQKLSGISENVKLCPMIDARRLEVYTALLNYKAQFITDTEAKIIEQFSFQNDLEESEILFFGNGALKCRDILNHRNAKFIDDIYPSARFMPELSLFAFNNRQFEDVAYFEPFYLKDFIATTPKNKVLNNNISGT